MKNVLKATYICKTCGEEVTDVIGNRYHTACIIDELYDTYANFKVPSSALRQRAIKRNIDVFEIRKQVYEDMRTQRAREASNDRRTDV